MITESKSRKSTTSQSVYDTLKRNQNVSGSIQITGRYLLTLTTDNPSILFKLIISLNKTWLKIS